jgi:hypothetical protein
VLWNLILGLLFLGANRYGVYITDECPQASYSCPSICDVDHKHLPLKECKNAKSLQEREEGNQSVQEGYEGTQESNSKKGILIDAKTE